MHDKMRQSHILLLAKINIFWGRTGTETGVKLGKKGVKMAKFAIKYP